MMIVLANTKGGVGKSTLAAHLALWAHDLGIQTALIDTDKQRSSSQWIGEAEPGITVRIATTPEECLKEATELRLGHDLIVGDGPAGLDDVSRTLLILADLAILPLTPSILDLRSVQQATDVLKFAQGINGGKPEGRIVLNKMKTRDSISKELSAAAQTLGVKVAKTVIRDLQAYRDAAGQATSVSRLGKKGKGAADEVDALFRELLGTKLRELKSMSVKKEVANG
jgi:chromosome partitioning protein